VISRSERNFVGAKTLSANWTDSSRGEPGFYVDRDHYCGRDFDRRADDGGAEFERRYRRPKTAGFVGSI
jgi:hypothetical protein